MSNHPLERELAAYEEHKLELVAQHEGRFVLVHANDVAGVYDTYNDALTAGYDRFGLQPFLVKQIQGLEQVQFITREITVCQS